MIESSSDQLAHERIDPAELAREAIERAGGSAPHVVAVIANQPAVTMDEQVDAIKVAAKEEDLFIDPRAVSRVLVIAAVRRKIARRRRTAHVIASHYRMPAPATCFPLETPTSPTSFFSS